MLELELIQLKKSLVAAAVLLSAHAASHAAFVIDMNQVGADVVATGSGSINTIAGGLDLFAATANFQGASNFHSNGFAFADLSNATSIPFSLWEAPTLTGPLSIGPGVASTIFADQTTGDFFFLSPVSKFVGLSQSYVSGSALSNAATWHNSSFSALGLTSGSYTWAWGSGATADSVTLNINAVAPVPEPESYALMLAGLGALGAVSRRQRRAR